MKSGGMLEESNETESNWSNGRSFYEGGNGNVRLRRLSTVLIPHNIFYSPLICLTILRWEEEKEQGKTEKIFVWSLVSSLEDFWEILLLKKKLQINQKVGVINVKLEVFVLNVKIYENLLLILNLCKVSKLCIVTYKELDV